GKAPEADRETVRKLLARVADEGGLVKKLLEQEKLIRSGKHKQPLGADASEEEVAEYRKAAGIPEKPGGYLEKLDGLVIGDADKEMVGQYLESAHAANMDPKSVKATLDWYYKTIEDQQAAQAEADAEYRAKSVEQMREAMGADYRRNMADLKAWLSSRDGLFDALNGARLADGTLFGDNPAVMNFLVEQMREINPLSTVVGAGSGSAEGLKDEIGKYEKMMRDDPKEYWKQENQDRYRQLLEAQEKVEARTVKVSGENARTRAA
ncbi:MAG TPA: hypothetical protein PKI99_00695, partial [Terrimesophilobacter sp.]|nr:hypothetical protein [Terrimesophilobacter sp.]